MQCVDVICVLVSANVKSSLTSFSFILHPSFIPPSLSLFQPLFFCFVFPSESNCTYFKFYTSGENAIIFKKTTDKSKFQLIIVKVFSFFFDSLLLVLLFDPSPLSFPHPLTHTITHAYSLLFLLMCYSLKRH